MLIVIADVEIKPNSLDEFKKWFSKTNQIVSQFDGFVSRKLLETRDGSHRILVEFENMDTFSKMHQSKEHDALRDQAIAFMNKTPSLQFYNVVAE